MIYTVRHVTRYLYPEPVRESVMEVRKHPATCSVQRCVNFSLSVQPEVRIFRYQDHLGNSVHHFDVPFAHSHLLVTAEAVVEIKPAGERPHRDLSGSWADLDRVLEEQDCFDMLLPSKFVAGGEALQALGGELKAERRANPYELALELTRAIHAGFAYDRSITKVDSPLELALESRRGVCQDFAHILLGLLRPLGVPCRYVSGYLFRRQELAGQRPGVMVQQMDWVHRQAPRGKPDHTLLSELAQRQRQSQTLDESGPSQAGPAQDGPEERSSHAWVEVLLPTAGGSAWVGFDPTLGGLSDDRHIRTCVGRDYGDVPPTKGVYRGGVAGELSYAVQVHLPEEPVEEDRFRTLT